MNVERAIRTVVDTGKVVLGERETLKAAKGNKIKLVIVAANCPPSTKATLAQLSARLNVPVHEFSGTTLALGSVCGKPFHVSMLGVVEAGHSGVLELIKK